MENRPVAILQEDDHPANRPPLLTNELIDIITALVYFLSLFQIPPLSGVKSNKLNILTILAWIKNTKNNDGV